MTDYEFPALQGRRVILRPIADSDYNWLYGQAINPEVGGRWRLHGVIPSFDVFTRILLGGSEANMVVCARTSSAPLGMVQLLRHDDRHKYAYLSAFFSKEAQGEAWPLEGLVLYLEHVFFIYDLRKIYLESLEPDLAQYQSLVGPLLVEEGRMRAHERVGSQYYDNVVLALYREAWDEFSKRVLRTSSSS